MFTKTFNIARQVRQRGKFIINSKMFGFFVFPPKNVVKLMNLKKLNPLNSHWYELQPMCEVKKFY